MAGFAGLLFTGFSDVERWGLWVTVALVGGYLLVLVGHAVRTRWVAFRAGGRAGVRRKSGPLPSHAALALGLHPGAVVAAFVAEGAATGRIEILSERKPVRLRFAARFPNLGPERELADALDTSGRLPAPAVRRLLDALHAEFETTPGAPAGESALKAVRERIARAWRDPASFDDPAERAWLLLDESEDRWREIPDTPGGEEVKRLVRLRNQMVSYLVDRDLLEDWTRTAERGYFRHRAERARAAGGA